VIICPSCGAENPEASRFCNSCGTRLSGTHPFGEERKHVSVLFVDLVGFTARSDDADPEDVRATLRPYHAAVKREIERFGGTVEKFIGDAVMAVFGAPVAHEDDPERAVRAALRILESIEEVNLEHGLELAVRAAVATGEAVVSLSARPGEGEGIATGDVVNVAARLQSEAPVGGLVVGEQTYRATHGAIEYADLEPVAVKGKVEPLSLWRALGATSRFGVDAEAAPRMPFVGREHEVRLLKETYERLLSESTIQLVTVIGEPGVGKTRLLSEFRGWLDDRPELVYWRQGRCIPYGDGITFWALGEIVKAHAGILESDDPAEAQAKLHSMVGGLADEVDRDWVRTRLEPLVGLVGGREATRDESFTAWQSFLEALATQRPLVLLFEDLHWSDAALLDFVERLVDWSSGLPILVLCSARPELYDLRPGWGGGKRNSTTVSLSALAHEETARLVSALLESAVLPAETQEALLERAGGNPLYAEEYVRMFLERGSAQDLPMPDTVQGIIAARLDSLPAERKALLHDASVIGKVFWAGALEVMAGLDTGAVREGLHSLAQRELVRPMRALSVGGQAEYAFWHALVRDVAYGQIPRASKAVKHRAAAEWIEAMAGDRVADHADLVAHHLGEAIALGRAAGDKPDPTLESQAAKFLELAGDRSRYLNVQRAEAMYRRALELLPPASTEHGRALLKAAEAAASAGRAEDAQRDFEDAARALVAAGDVAGAGRAYSLLGRLYFGLGGADRMERALVRSLELLESLPPGPELVDAYGRMAALRTLQGRRPEESLVWADKSIELADELGVRGRDGLNARMWRGNQRCELGDLDGMADLETALSDALELGVAVPAYVNLADSVWRVRGPGAALGLLRDAIAYAERRGTATHWASAEACWMLYDLGEWDALVQRAEEILSFSGIYGRGQPNSMASAYLAHVLVRRGLTADATAVMEEALPQAREIEDPQVVGPALVASALIDEARGDLGSARARLEEWEVAIQDRPYFRAQNLTDAVRIACAAGDAALAERLREGVVTAANRDRLSDLTAQAEIAAARGDASIAHRAFVEAAQEWRELECVLEHGLALLGASRCLLELDGQAEAHSLREQAHAIFARLEATPLMAAARDPGSLGSASTG
jgi:class 3 adenylate cyclase/tetratricopeptide (TPR) repeat protein